MDPRLRGNDYVFEGESYTQTQNLTALPACAGMTHHRSDPV